MVYPECDPDFAFRILSIGPIRGDISKDGITSMDEATAKTKWCPMRRMTEVGNVKFHNTEPNAPFTLNCIGSACMMWHSGYRLDGGYCGLAGKP